MVLMVMGYRLDTVEMQGHWVSAVKKKITGQSILLLYEVWK